MKLNLTKMNIIGIMITTFVLMSSTGFAQKKKNLLFIITDQQQYKALSIAGNSVIGNSKFR